MFMVPPNNDKTLNGNVKSILIFSVEHMQKHLAALKMAKHPQTPTTPMAGVDQYVL